MPECTQLLRFSAQCNDRLLPATCAAQSPPHGLSTLLLQIKSLGPSVFQDTVHMVMFPCSRPAFAAHLLPPLFILASLGRVG